MKHSQLAIQFYTLRDFCRTASDFAASCKRVRAIGYEAIQISGIGPIPENEIVEILKGEGLTCCATHEPADTVRKEPAKVVDRLQKLGVKYTAYPFPAGVDWSSQEHIDSLVADLDAAGAVLRAAGQVLTYHNHANEFIKTASGQSALDYIYAKSDPQNLMAELDTYWVQFGGGDPTEWCKKMTGRLPLLHMKDYGFGADNRPFFAEVGSGNFDWSRILPAAEAAGCEFYIVEQDVCPGDPFDSIQKSYDYLSENFIQS
ncbi:MAG TPA: sugar phosphate isomerase/epimerase [Chthoniobacterales bacterium]|jgi:sugar phosphate isomerase/epimerase